MFDISENNDATESNSSDQDQHPSNGGDENNSPQHAPDDDSLNDMSDSVETPGSDILGLQNRILEMEGEIATYKDNYLRALSEMENQKRRMERERSDLLKYGNEKLLKDVIPVLDSFDKAFPSSGNLPEGKEDIEGVHDQQFYIGVQLVKKQLLEVLRTHGLEVVEAVDKKFDPNFHQAIQRVDSTDHEEEIVKDEFAKGYILNGRLLRPSMVSVFVPCEEKQT